MRETVLIACMRESILGLRVWDCMYVYERDCPSIACPGVYGLSWRLNERLSWGACMRDCPRIACRRSAVLGCMYEGLYVLGCMDCPGG